MRFVIIGNGVAGVTAARVLSDAEPSVLSDSTERAEVSAGVEVEVYTQEAHHYYPRPRLQSFLAGEIEQEELPLYPPAWYEKRGIAVHLGLEVVELDPRAKRIALADGRGAHYDRLLLATGSHPFIPPVEGVDKGGVFTLRTIEDALAIKRWACPERCPEPDFGELSRAVEGPSRRAEGAKRAVIVGGGLLGLEAARALTVLGLEVAVLERGPYLLRRQLDAKGGALMRELIEALGIEVALNASCRAILGNGQASGVLLQDGRRIEGELILISAGVRCNVRLAQEAGLEVNRGVVVDEHLRTSADDIYAAGDVAECQGRLYGIIPACLEQARAAAVNMLGREQAEYQGTIPSNVLQVVGIDCASIGIVHPPEGEGYQELRKSEADVYKTLVLKDGRLVGAILLGDGKDVAPIGRLIRMGTDISRYAERLLDDDFDWKELL